MASKFFEHFIQIVDVMNTAGGTGLWGEADGFYHDQIDFGTHTVPLRTRSLVGLLPLIAVDVLDRDRIDRLPGFKKRYEWFLEHRKDLARHITYCAEVLDVVVAKQENSAGSETGPRCVKPLARRCDAGAVFGRTIGIEVVAEEHNQIRPPGRPILRRKNAFHPRGVLVNIGDQEASTGLALHIS